MFKPIERLDVFLRLGQDELLVGVMVSEKRRIHFQYAPDFLTKGIPLSPSRLPLSGHVQSGDPPLFLGLHGVFFDSLPDGWGLLLMDRHFARIGVSRENIGPLDRLAFIGDRGMGALVYRPEHKMISPVHQKIDLEVLARESLKVLDGSPEEILPQLLLLGGSPGGARPKVLVGFNPASGHMVSGVSDIPPGYRHFLVKFPAESDPPYPGETEYAYSLMAREAGINVPDTRLFPGIKNQASFGIERFDRIGNERLHLHTLGGLIGSDHRIPNCSYEMALKVTGVLTRNRGDVVSLLRQMIFNIATHNRDDHVRNFSFLLDRHASWKLAPAYDLTYARGPGGEHSMTIAGEGKNPTFDHILRVGKDFDFKNSEVIKMIDDVSKAVDRWTVFAEEAGIPESVASRIEKTFYRFAPPNNIRFRKR